ncbi:MAG: glycosyltransferase family 4 protein [Candidatus Marinimicrobia bacterium]|nr:glycosyltransferase family 4 protein [Candidatus Neomarinimicrobiota bacterium]
MAKICITCAGFKKKDLHKQPWAYVNDIAETLSHNGSDVVLVTDGKREHFNIGNIKIIRVPRLWKWFSFMGYTSETLEIIKKEYPDIVIEVIGPSSFIGTSSGLDKLSQELGIPLIGILMAPIYRVSEIANIGLRELLLHYSYIMSDAIGSLIPKILVRRKSQTYSKLVVLTYFNRQRLIEKGVSIPLKVIPAKIKSEWFYPVDTKLRDKIKADIGIDKIPTIIYFTSPLTLRGTDTLILAFSRLNKELKAKLIFLSRQDKKAKKEEAYLKHLMDKLSLQNVVIVSRNLKLDELKAYLSTATIIALPFKIIVSDFPLSILESMALKKPVVSTNVGGISEVLGCTQVVPPNNVNELAKRLKLILSNPKLRKKLMKRNYLVAKTMNKEFDKNITKVIKEVLR